MMTATEKADFEKRQLAKLAAIDAVCPGYSALTALVTAWGRAFLPSPRARADGQPPRLKIYTPPKNSTRGRQN